MTGNTDFVEMFRELGLSANCSLDEFKRAYRRCVAQLHPDRVGERGDQTRLQRLTVTYEAALDFNRRYGRLPGYAAQAPPRVETPVPATAAPRRPRRRVRISYILIFLAVIVLAWLLWDDTPGLDEEPAVDSPSLSAVDSAPGAAVVTETPTRRLAFGMTKDEVRIMEGEPVAASESQWEYGPSWISFECGEVDGWYSSPLRPLKFASQHSTAIDAAQKKNPLRCFHADSPR